MFTRQSQIDLASNEPCLDLYDYAPHSERELQTKPERNKFAEREIKICAPNIENIFLPPLHTDYYELVRREQKIPIRPKVGRSPFRAISISHELGNLTVNLSLSRR